MPLHERGGWEQGRLPWPSLLRGRVWQGLVGLWRWQLQWQWLVRQAQVRCGGKALLRFQHMPLAERDDFVVSLWEQVRPQVLEALRTFGVNAVPRTSAADLQALARTADVTVPALRRQATHAAAALAAAHGFAAKDGKGQSGGE